MQSIAQVQNVQKINAVSTGKVVNEKSMMVWRPHGNKMFETFSFLPPLSDADLSKQVQYLLNNGWTPCLEFEDPAHAYTDGHGNSGLDSSINTNYYDNRYWVMWKLPMYGCNDPSEVLTEVKACVKAFPNCYVRCAGFDNIKQVQCHSFLVYRPKLSPMEGGARDINAVSTGKVVNEKSMMVWRPHGNNAILVEQRLDSVPRVEDPAHAYTDGHGNSGLDSSINTNYYDNRYWVMWKLPMYGCNDPSEVLTEVKACVKAFPNCYVRCAGFDNIKQVQCHSFLVYRPKLSPMEGGARDVADRQI
ncbi:unnamed protein product [Bathycoccus prasinos]